MDTLKAGTSQRPAFCEPCRLSAQPSAITNKNSKSSLATRALPPIQEVIVGGAVFSAVGAALVNGMKGEPQVCSSCGGNGGIMCFACEGSGSMNRVSADEMAAANLKRDPLGRSIDKRECVACKGCGKLLCKNCNGSGYR